MYVIKAYDYDGNFYGYFADHPEEPDMPYYDDNPLNAKGFDSYDEAATVIERFADSSELECIIIEKTECFVKVDDMVKKISSWVKENYGESELSNPSWNIESLAKYLVEGE